jgi:hypothetical protein
MPPRVLSPIQPEEDDALIARDASVRVRRALAAQRDIHKPVRLRSRKTARRSPSPAQPLTSWSVFWPTWPRAKRCPWCRRTPNSPLSRRPT